MRAHEPVQLQYCITRSSCFACSIVTTTRMCMYEPAHGSLVFRYELLNRAQRKRTTWLLGRKLSWCLHVRLCESSQVDCICGHTTVHVCVYKTILCTCNCHKTVHVYVGTRLYIYMWAQLRTVHVYVGTRLYSYVCLHKTVHVHVYIHNCTVIKVRISNLRSLCVQCTYLRQNLST